MHRGLVAFNVLTAIVKRAKFRKIVHADSSHYTQNSQMHNLQATFMIMGNLGDLLKCPNVNKIAQQIHAENRYENDLQ